MSFLSTVGRMFLGELPSDGAVTRSAAFEYPDLDTKLAEIVNNRDRMTFRVPSVDEALGVPAIFSAVTLIAGSMGTLTMDAYRNQRLVRSEDRPRLIVRPNPFSKPYDFWFLSAFYKATRGERWWWVAKRDPIDGHALSLFPVPPWEITVAENDNNRLRPIIKWLDRTIPNEDMIHDFWFPDHSGLRGRGPLQMAGAAVSAAVEAQQWAANFFSGSIPSLIGTTEQDMTEDELQALDRQWNEKPPNLPRWMTNGMKMGESPFDPERAQLTEVRQYSVGDVARMFSMPGSLIEYQMSGSSLTYRNDAGIWTDFQRRCLGPIFAEPVEQDMSDLLTRSTTAQFDFSRLLRADDKTRYETYQVGIDAGFLTPEEARRKEGFDPGSSEYAPVPVAPPQAIPTLLPVNRSRAALEDLRCGKCGRLAGRVSGMAEIKCQRCGAMVVAA